MKSQVHLLLSRIKRRELIQLCNEKMVCAARDLAEFTKNGINASYIVALAHKCEDFESTLDERETQPFSDSRQVEQEIQEGLDKICELGKRIWEHDPAKYQDYLIPDAGHEVQPGPSSAHAN